MSSKVETLEAAKRELIEHGWTQGAYQFGDSLCVVGAIAKAKCIDNYAAELASETFFLEGVVGWGRKSGCSIAAWNDDPHRTFNDVMSAFDKAILLAKEEESA